MKAAVSAISRIKRLVIFFDFLFIWFSYLGNYSYRFNVPFQSALSELFVYFVVFMTLSCLYTLGAYDLDSEESYLSVVLKQVLAILISAIIVVSTIYFSRSDVAGFLGRGVLLGSFLTFLALSLVMKILVIQYIKILKESWSWLVIGSNDLLERLNKDIFLNGPIGYMKHVVQNQDYTDLDINEHLKKKWSGLIIATKAHLNLEMTKILLHKKLEGLIVLDLIQLYEKFWKKVPVFYIEDRWFLTIDGFSISSNKIGLRLKRLFDIVISFFVLLATWPLMLVTYFFIKLESHGPAIFVQTRTGKDGREFSIYKFRSMYLDAEKDGIKWAQTNDRRVTRVGKYLRLFRIDELPQIFNVLNGDMSFIGPRPERPEFNDLLEKQIPYYQLRHLVQPGITGWAQVQYPYGASVEDAIEKLQFDLYYIKNYSFILDLKILVKTIKVIFFGKGR
jgi:exopolysaccharide biosynthesis polyprenyl glycosylphosphotransferase